MEEWEKFTRTRAIALLWNTISDIERLANMIDSELGDGDFAQQIHTANRELKYTITKFALKI